MKLLVLSQSNHQCLSCHFSGSCTFEDSTCGWQNLFKNVSVTEDTNDWLQGSGDDHLGDTGPETDHYNSTSGRAHNCALLVSGILFLHMYLKRLLCKEIIALFIMVLLAASQKY